MSTIWNAIAAHSCPNFFYGFSTIIQVSGIFSFLILLLNARLTYLLIYGFTSRSRIFHIYGDVTIAGEGLQNFGLCSALRAFEQGGIFILPHLRRHEASVFPVSSKDSPIQSLLTTHERGIITKVQK